jgi:hypothetical protein
MNTLRARRASLLSALTEGLDQCIDKLDREVELGTLSLTDEPTLWGLLTFSFRGGQVEISSDFSGPRPLKAEVTVFQSGQEEERPETD